MSDEQLLAQIGLVRQEHSHWGLLILVVVTVGAVVALGANVIRGGGTDSGEGLPGSSPGSSVTSALVPGPAVSYQDSVSGTGGSAVTAGPQANAQGWAIWDEQSSYDQDRLCSTYGEQGADAVYFPLVDSGYAVAAVRELLVLLDSEVC